MFKKSIVFLTLAMSLLFVQPSYASTIVSFDATDLADIAAFQFDILTPAALSNADFNASWPSGWLSLSSGDTVAAFDSTGTASLITGEVGYFDEDSVTLGNWVLGNQDSMTLTEGVDYFVHATGGGYLISASEALAVPIPGAIWLLFSGMLGLLGIRRRIL